MDLDTSKTDSNMTDEEDCSQDDDMAEDGGRRRRFCNERAKQQQQQHHNKPPTRPSIGSSSSQSTKLPKLKNSTGASVMSPRYRPKQMNMVPTQMGRRVPYPLIRPRSLRRPMISYETQHKPLSNDKRRCTTKKVFNTADQMVPHDTVIFVNPMFVKKFLKKATIMMHPPDVDMAKETAKMPVENFSFRQSPADALQAAATMAIIRLVTECIEDDSKRDEKSNKILASRLMEQMRDFVKREPDAIQCSKGPDPEPSIP